MKYADKTRNTCDSKIKGDKLHLLLRPNLSTLSKFAPSTVVQKDRNSVVLKLTEYNTEAGLILPRSYKVERIEAQSRFGDFVLGYIQ